MAWRPISEAPRHHPLFVRDLAFPAAPGELQTKVGILMNDGKCVIYEAVELVDSLAILRMEWNDRFGFPIAVKPKSPRPYTNCDTSGPVYSPEWFSECCDLAAKIEAEKHAAKAAEVMPPQQPGAAGDHTIDSVPAGLNPGEMSPLSTTITSTEKRRRGRPVGSKSREPYKHASKAAVAYFTPLILELRGKNLTYPEIVKSLEANQHPYPVPNLKCVWRWADKAHRSFAESVKRAEGYVAAKTNEPTIVGEVKYVGGLFGMADNVPRVSESEVGIGE